MSTSSPDDTRGHAPLPFVSPSRVMRKRATTQGAEAEGVFLVSPPAESAAAAAAPAVAPTPAITAPLPLQPPCVVATVLVPPPQQQQEQQQPQVQQQQQQQQQQRQKPAMDERAMLYKFLCTPFETEKTIILGFFACMDVLLFTLTVLPLRAASAALSLPLSLFSTRSRLTTAQWFDLCRGLVMALCILALSYVDSSTVYHLIRGQSTLKLYVIYNVLEILDKLCSSFAQDLFDSIFWSLSDRPAPPTEVFSLPILLLIAVVYLVLHSLLLFMQVMALNVTVNSHNNALLTLLVSNNVLELKGSVFKRAEFENVFQMCSADALERFQLFAFLVLISLHNFSAISWDLVSQPRMVVNVAVATMAVCTTECLVDMTKHSFVGKFNMLPLNVYRHYRSAFCRDITTRAPSVPDNASGVAVYDSTNAFARRVGFSALPLTCLLVRVAYRSMPVLPGVVVLGMFFCFRVVLRQVLLRFSRDSLRRENTGGPEAEMLARTYRYVMCKGRMG